MHCFAKSYPLMYDWSFVYSQTTTDSAIEPLSPVVTEARNQANPCSNCKNFMTYPLWPCSTYQYCIRKKRNLTS